MSLRLIDEQFEEMGRTKLFDTTESRNIRSKRRQFEHKINGIASDPTLQDYENYIEHEKHVLCDLKSRNKGNEGKILELSMMGRIKSLYETATRKFSSFELYMSFFTFCKEINHTHAVSSIVENMIQNHSNVPEAWQTAAKFYAHEECNVAKAVLVTRRGLGIHKNSKLLYKECIKLELIECRHRLQNSCKKSSSKSIPEEGTEMACVDNLKIYVTEVLNKVSECKFLFEILEILQEYMFTVGVQDIIVKHLRENYAQEVEVWHVLAQRENEGIFYPSDQHLNSASTRTKFKLERCCETYKEGLQQIPESKKGELWSHYLDYLLQQCEDDFASFKVSKRDTLLNALEQACECSCLLENHFAVWLEYAGEDEAAQVLEKGLKEYPNSLQLWQLLMKCEINKGTPLTVWRAFQRGTDHLKERSLSLWTGILQYCMMYSNDELVESLYEEGVKQPPEISSVLKQRYLEWLAMTKKIEVVRQRYLQMANMEPLCKGLHLTMARLESYELQSNLSAWETALKIGCEQFGKEDVEVWINYLQFLHVFKKARPIDIKKVLKLIKDSLPEALFPSFEDAYKHLLVT